MISFLVVLSVLIYVVGFVLLRREIKALRKAQSEKVQDPATALLEKLIGSDSQFAKLIQQIHDNVLVVSQSQVTLATNQQVVVTEQSALRKEFADLAFATRTLNAIAKRTAAEEKALAGVDPRASLREQIKVAAEAAEASRPRETVAQMQARSGLIAPGNCPLLGMQHPQDVLPKK